MSLPSATGTRRSATAMLHAPDSIISTNQVYENDWETGGLGPMRNHFTTDAELAFIKRRRVDGNQQIRAHLD